MADGGFPIGLRRWAAVSRREDRPRTPQETACRSTVCHARRRQWPALHRTSTHRFCESPSVPEFVRLREGLWLGNNKALPGMSRLSSLPTTPDKSRSAPRPSAPHRFQRRKMSATSLPPCTPSRTCGIRQHMPCSVHHQETLRTPWHNDRSTSRSNQPFQRKEARHSHRLGNRRHSRSHSSGSASGTTGVPSCRRPAGSHSASHRGRTHAGSPNRLWHTPAPSN